MIEFEHSDLPDRYKITSPQLPLWECAAATRQMAIAQCAASLRAHLAMAADLHPDIYRAVSRLLSVQGVASEG